MVNVTRSTKSPWKVLRGEIAAGDSAVVDISEISNILSYIITAKGGGEIKSLHYNVLKDGTLKSNVHSKLGGLNINVDEAEVGGTIEITVTNNEAFEIDYQIAVLKLFK
jgi:hypothetical protein